MANPITLRRYQASENHLSVSILARKNEAGTYRGYVDVRVFSNGIRTDHEYPCVSDRQTEGEALSDALMLSNHLPRAE